MIFQFSSPLLVLRLRRSATGRGRLTVERPARGVKRCEVRSWKCEWFSHFNFQTSRPKENAFRPRQIGKLRHSANPVAHSRYGLASSFSLTEKLVPHRGPTTSTAKPIS